MARRLIYVGQDDDVSDLAGKVGAAESGDEVALVVPPGAQAFQTPLNLRLLRSVGAKRGLTAVVVSPDPRLQELSQGAGMTVFSSVAAFEGDVPVAVRGPGPSPRMGLSARPPAPPPPPIPAGGPPAPAGGAAGARQPGPALPIPSGGGNWAATPPVAPAAAWESAAAALRRSPSQMAPAAPQAPANGAPSPSLAGIPDLAEPASPWASPWHAPDRGTGFSSNGAATALAPPPARPTATAPPAPPGRGSGRPAAPAPGRAGGGRRSMTPLYFVLIALGVVGILAFLALSPSATVTVTVGEQPLSVSPTLQGTADPTAASQPDHVLTKMVSDSVSQQFQATPTGTKTIPAAKASGQVALTANSLPGYCISPGQLTFQTASGTQFLASNSTGVEVLAANEAPPPGNLCNLPSGFSVGTLSIQAAGSGSAGNVAANSIDQWSPSYCSGGGSNNYCTDIAVANPSATTGGTDPSQQTVASASDVQSWQNQINQIESQLTAKVKSDLSAKAAGERPALDPNGGGLTITPTVTPSSITSVQAQAQMSAATVTVAMSGQETVYDPAAVQTVVLHDLTTSPDLPAGDDLVPGQLRLTAPQVIQAGSDGTFAMAVTGVDYYRPALNLGQMRTQVTGRNPGDVPGIIEQQIPDAQTVTVHETPVQLFFMPFFSSRIQIVEAFVTPAPPPSNTTTG